MEGRAVGPTIRAIQEKERQTMSNIAYLDTTVLDTAAKFFRIMQKAGADFTGPMQNIEKRHNLVDYLKLGCPVVDSTGAIVATPVCYDLARLILNHDFITPNEVMARRNLTYTDEQLRDLETSFPSIDVIIWCRSKHAILIPAPPEAMSLLDIRDLKPNLISNKEGAWYAAADQSFAREDKIKATSWLALGKSLMPDSRGKKPEDQLFLLSEDERLPNVAEIAWGLTTYKEVRGTHLMNEGDYTRTTSRTWSGLHVVIGGLGRGIIDIDFYHPHSPGDKWHKSSLGIVPALKLDH